MSNTYIPTALRRQVTERAQNCCEYCLMGDNSRAGARIKPLTSTGRVTVYLLRLNAEERFAERELLLLLDAYPCSLISE